MQAASCAMAVFPPYACLNEIDEQKHRERKRQHHRGQRRRARIIIFLKLDDDEKWRNLRLVGRIARDEDHGAIFADTARKGERKAGNNGRLQARQKHPPDRLETGSAKRCRRLLHLAADFLDDRLHGAHHEGQSDEDERNDDAHTRKDDADAIRAEQAADPAIRRIDRGQRNACNGSRQRKGNIHDGIDETASRKAIAHQNPSQNDPKDHIDQRSDEGGAEARFKRLQRALVGDDPPEAGKAHIARTQHQSRQRNENDKGQIGNTEAERQPETGNNARLSEVPPCSGLCRERRHAVFCSLLSAALSVGLA
ncbi:Hypothetical protein BSUIS_A0112 [Brucella suis ATCC 23445]|uniref:Uncharacterized protein n=1 Tax=Brucella suis (strain ATCC 23445 / NCTC 10510) TaxID=470137 RepID=B0CIM0_BRUSI|nr:Hypothetical protein BSUIS_A0112 [Brucella suis ATCC 23445]